MDDTAADPAAEDPSADTDASSGATGRGPADGEAGISALVDNPNENEPLGLGPPFDALIDNRLSVAGTYRPITGWEAPAGTPSWADDPVIWFEPWLVTDPGEPQPVAPPYLPNEPPPEVIPGQIAQPQLDPAYRRAEEEIGRLVIPRMNLDETLRSALWIETIDAGPAHWPGSATPGQPGNAVVLGRRVLAGAEFLDLDLLEMDDPIIFVIDGQVSVYRVIGGGLLRPSNPEIVDQSGRSLVTLVTNHPPGRRTWRAVVRGELDPATQLTLPQIDALVPWDGQPIG